MRIAILVENNKTSKRMEKEIPSVHVHGPPKDVSNPILSDNMWKWAESLPKWQPQKVKLAK